MKCISESIRDTPQRHGKRSRKALGKQAAAIATITHANVAPHLHV